MLVVVGKAAEVWRRAKDGYNSMETDLTIAMDHMILAATNEDVGTCWIAAYDPDVLRDALGLGEGDRVFCITPLGYPRNPPKETSEKPRKKLGEIVQFL